MNKTLLLFACFVFLVGLSGSVSAKTLTGDVNNNGNIEQVSTDGKQLTVRNSDGQVLWSIPTAATLDYIRDVDGDGISDIVVSTSQETFCYNGFGALISRHIKIVGVENDTVNTTFTASEEAGDVWNITQIGSGKYSSIAADANNVVHIVWGEDTNIFYSNSSSDWEKIPITSGYAISSYWDRPPIYVDKNNDVYIAWVDIRDEWSSSDGSAEGWNIFYATSKDGWVEHLVTSATNLRVGGPAIVVDKTGDVHISYTRHTVAGWPYNNQIFYANKDSGWFENRVSYTPYSRIYGSGLDVDSLGVAHVTFSNACTGADPGGWACTNHIWYAKSSDGWINKQIDSDATDNWWDDRVEPSIAVDSSDAVHIVWRDSRNTALPSDPAFHGGIPNRMEIYYANSKNGWVNREISLPVDTTGPAVKSTPSLIIDENGVVHTTWLHRTTDEYYSQTNLYYSNSTDWDKAINITELPDEPVLDEMGYEPAVYMSSSQQALVVDSKGVVHVTWFDDRTDEYKIYYANNEQPSPTPIPASVDILPDTLNLDNHNMMGSGSWITTYIELPEGYDVADINVSTVLLNDTIAANLYSSYIGDYDGDGIPDLRVKFIRSDVTDLVKTLNLNLPAYVELTATGSLTDGTQFEGTDTVRVTDKSKQKHQKYRTRKRR